MEGSERFESTEPETDDVEGHRAANRNELGETDERFEVGRNELGKEDDEADDVEGHRLMNENENEDDRAAGRQANRTANAGDDDDFEAHRLVDRTADRTAGDKNID